MTTVYQHRDVGERKAAGNGFTSGLGPIRWYTNKIHGSTTGTPIQLWISFLAVFLNFQQKK